MLFFRGEAGKCSLHLSGLPGEQLVPQAFWVDGQLLMGHSKGPLCHEGQFFGGV